ncbi:16S rRNA (adenine(1518)-N(6)/adenine(1519)-N(6))-dimethyltransferase RsmA [Cardinium endosymbiont of Tipula unca]|uniref:16S rRNA (adenine(1518)-N(6)/adenine(1519)-N(6))- dimethyltransferase RsmA n=1 Tax=Cardinium endosymbiont of Tipula unca TaxID=3066216 RepID=UPI0030D1A2DA
MATPIKAKKSLGQHFLKDPTVSFQIASLLSNDSLSKTIIEVGPGTGSLTEMLLQRPIQNLHLVEIDRDLIPYLKKKYTQLSDRIIEADFLTLSLSGQFKEEHLIIVGNFPYNISSQIFFKILGNRHIVDEVVGMVQKEVGQRLTAKPGNKIYGIPSVLLQAFYTVEYCFTVPPCVFSPPPKVDSAVITMRRNNVNQLSCNESLFFEIVKKGFQQRRKKLSNALHTLNISNKNCTGLLHKRAEELSVLEFVELTNILEANALN